MTKTEAKKLVNLLLWKFTKARSNMIEALGQFPASWNTLSPIEQSVLKKTHPGLFSDKMNIIEVLDRVEAKGDDISPIDLYNILVIVQVTYPALEAVLYAMGVALKNKTVLPRVDQGVPKWMLGFDPELID